MSDTQPKWEQLAKEQALDCSYYVVSHDRYRRPDGSLGDYYYVDIPGSTMIVPVLDDGRLVLGRQFRYLQRRWSLEFPAGGVPRGVDFLDNAKRELLEESGYSARHWQKLGEFAPYNGVSNELCHVFEATGLEHQGQELEATEEIEVVAMTLAELEAEFDTGHVWDGMTINAWAIWKRFRKKDDSTAS